MSALKRKIYQLSMSFLSTLVLLSIAITAVACFVATKALLRVRAQERTLEIVEGQYGDLKREYETFGKRLVALEGKASEDHQRLIDCGVENLDQDEEIQVLQEDVEMIVDGLKDEVWKDPNRC